MADVVTSGTRSRMMAAIGRKDTRPELLVRRYLHAAGLRFRLHVRGLPGTPDLVLPKHRAVVFVHGCFWHRHTGCRFTTTPSTRAHFWATKFAANVARDKRKADLLTAAGWQVFTVWECEAGDELALDALVWRILAGEPPEAEPHTDSA